MLIKIGHALGWIYPTMLVWNMPGFNLKKTEQARGEKRVPTPGTMVKYRPRSTIMIVKDSNNKLAA